jgi:hypothetical protein
MKSAVKGAKRMVASVSAALVGMWCSAAAADMNSYADITGSAAYESNVFLTSKDAIASSSATSRLDSGASWQGEINTLAVSFSGEYQRFDDSALTPATSVGVQTTLTHEHEYGETRIGLGYADESSLLDAFEQDGKFVGDERQQTLSGSLSRRFDLSEATSLLSSVDVAHVTYTNTPNGVFRENYDFANGSTMCRTELSESLTLGFGAVASWYGADSSGFNNTVTTVGPAVSADYEFNDHLSMFAEVSYRITDTQTRIHTFQVDSSGNDYFGHVELKRRFDRGSVALSARRSVEPGSNGQQDIRDEFGVSFENELTERMTLRGGAAYIDNRSDQTSSGDRTAFAGDVALDWTMSEHTHATLAYRFLWQDESGAQASGNTVTLSLTRRIAGDES